jgi:hypothetical protein
VLAEFTLTPTALDFGSQSIGTSTQLGVKVRNSGPGLLPI